MKKLIIPIVLGLIVASPAFAGWFSSSSNSSSKTELDAAETNQQRLVQQVPIPNIQDSLERRNVAKRAETFNKSDKVSYVYLVSFGKVMAFYTAQGKISSLQSYLNPTDRLVNERGSKCEWASSDSPCFVMQAPEIDGTYGSNPEGIFFYTTEGAYVEWNGEYMVSDQPLKLATPPELVREVK